jgi:transcriptional regulator with XRE-family HTH domain
MPTSKLETGTPVSAFRELRLAAGYATVPALAAKLGIAQELVYGWEYGNRPPWRIPYKVSRTLAP